MRSKNRFKWVMIVLVLALALLGSTRITPLLSGFKVTHDTTTKSHNLEQQISKMSELTTVKYMYKDVLEFNDSMKIRGINLPLTNKKYLIVYGGYVKAGVDLKDAKVDMVDADTVRLIVGKPKILDNVIDEESISVYDEKDGLFNKITLTDYTDVQKENKAKLEKEIIESGLLEESEKNAKELLTTFLVGLGFEDVTITFK